MYGRCRGTSISGGKLPWKGPAEPQKGLAARRGSMAAAPAESEPKAESGGEGDGGDELSEQELQEYYMWFRKAHIDSLSQLGMLPDLFIGQMVSTAKKALRWRMRMLLVLKAARNRRRLQSKKITEKPRAAVLMESPVFKHWPPDAVQKLLDTVTPWAFDSGEFVYYMGEPCTSGVVILTDGTVEETMAPCRKKELALLWTHTAPQVLGDFVQVTKERHPAHVVTKTPCEAWVLRSEDVAREYGELPAEAKARVSKTVLASLGADMRRQLPVTVPMLREACSVLSQGTDFELSELLGKLVPRVVKQGETICMQDTPSSAAFILRRGSVTEHRFCTATETTKTTTIPAISCFGELDMVFREKRKATVVAATMCYIYTLSYSKLAERVSLLSMSCMKALEVRKERMDRSVVEGCLPNCPFFCGLLEAHPGFQSALAKLFAPRVSSHNELLASASQRIDGILLVAAGDVRIGGYRDLPGGEEVVHPGECIGYTGLVQQRWSFPVLSCGYAECWVLPFAKLVPFLKENGMFHTATKISRELYRTQQRRAEEEVAAEEVTQKGVGMWRRAVLSVKTLAALTSPLSSPLTSPFSTSAGAAGGRGGGGGGRGGGIDRDFARRFTDAAARAAACPVNRVCNRFAASNRLLRDLCKEEGKTLRMYRETTKVIQGTAKLLPRHVATSTPKRMEVIDLQEAEEDDGEEEEEEEVAEAAVAEPERPSRPAPVSLLERLCQVDAVRWDRWRTWMSARRAAPPLLLPPACSASAPPPDPVHPVTLIPAPPLPAASPSVSDTRRDYYSL